MIDTEPPTILMSWFWFIYLPWNEFMELVQGTHQFKDQEHYDNQLATYDKPFVENDTRNYEIRMNALFDAGNYAVIQ